jgi:hypothetical protein
MPTTEHNALAELFSIQPILAVALLRDRLGLALPPFAAVEVTAGDFTQTIEGPRCWA